MLRPDDRIGLIASPSTFGRAPVIAAHGAGVNSTAMIIELQARSEPIDMVLMADHRSERPETDDF